MQAEDVLPDLLREYRDVQELVAIVDPPRAGLHKSALSALLGCPQVRLFAPYRAACFIGGA